MTKTRRTLFWTLCLVLPLFVMEMMAFGVDWLLVSDGPQKKLLTSFPAQIRLSNAEIAKAFPNLALSPQVGQFLGFDFDPVMGFRSLDALEWYGVGPDEDLLGKYLIVTFGGSTTVGDNWPKYLIDEAKQAGVREDIVVLNAGLWGYMSFNEKIYFSSWILPMLAELGVQPSLILTMDGVNDVWYRILGYFEAQNTGVIWTPSYHGYHQHHASDMADIKTVGGAVKQLLVNSSSSLYHISCQLMPYTMLMVYKGGQRLFASASYRKLPSKADLSTITLSREVEDKIVGGFESALLGFLGEAQVRDVPFVAYLQPVVHKEYYPFTIPVDFYYPSIDYMGVSLNSSNRFFTRLQTPSVVETESLYRKCDHLYKTLGEKYPHQFTSLIYGFYDVPSGEGLYQKDAVHYANAGKKYLAELVMSDLLAKKILHQQGGASQ